MNGRGLRGGGERERENAKNGLRIDSEGHYFVRARHFSLSSHSKVNFTELYDHSFMSLLVVCWKLVPEYTTCLGCKTAVVKVKVKLESTSLNPTERLMIRPCMFMGRASRRREDVRGSLFDRPSPTAPDHDKVGGGKARQAGRGRRGSLRAELLQGDRQ